MQKYTIQTEVIVPATAEHEIEAKSLEEAESIVRESIEKLGWESPYWQKPHHPWWPDAKSFAVSEW